MRRICSFFIMVIIAFCLSGCSKPDDNNNKQKESSKTDFVVEDISDNEILYYMAFNAEEASVAEQVKNTYLFRYTNGEIKDCIDHYINPEVLMQPVESDYNINDTKWDNINENGELRVGIIENGKFAFVKQSEDSTKNAAGCFDSIARLICMKLKLKSDISMYNSKDEAVSALKNNQIDIIIGIDDNTNQELIYSFPIIHDHAIICKVNDLKEEAIRYITSEQYREKTDGLEHEIEYHVDLEECFDLMQHDEKANYAVICMLSDLSFTDSEQLSE